VTVPRRILVTIHQVRRERERRAQLTAKAGVLARVVSYGARLILIPLSLELLGPERYGLWLTVGSLIAWLGMSDFGFSQGLVNAIAESSGLDDRAAIRRLVSTGFTLFALLSLILILLVIPASSWRPLERLLGVAGNPALAGDAHLLLLICGIFFAASLSLRAVDSVCQGLQEGYLAAGSAIGAAALNLVAVAVLYWRGASLSTFALAMAAPGLLATGALGVYLFVIRHPDLRPSLRQWDRSALGTLIRFGGPLFVLQLANLAVLYSMNLLIANRLGAGEVPKYSIPYSLFLIVAGLCYLIVQPYIPAYAEALRRGDVAWIRQRALKSLGITTGLMASAGLVLVAVGQPLIRLWAGPSVVPEIELLVFMAVFSVLAVSAATNGVLLIGLGRLWVKALLQTAAAGIFVISAWMMLPHLGLVAVPLAGIAAFMADALISLLYALSFLRSWSQRSTPPPEPVPVSIIAVEYADR
jgi:O-antigen/teichoic acid export membrane protein